MKKLHFFYLSLILAVFLSSCRSTKDFVLLQETRRHDAQVEISSTIPQIKIQPNDNLFLSILTLDPEVNKLFNPNIGDGMAGSSQAFETPSGQYINGYRVSDEGVITLPILGEIHFAGLSLTEAENRLKDKAMVYLKKPTVQVKFLNFKVNILGEVINPGIYYNYEGSINVLEAISMANGMTDYADIKNVLVKRNIDNEIKTYNLNLSDRSVYNSEVFYLQPDDMIYIPPGKLRSKKENSATYNQVLSTLSTLMVAIALVLKL